MMAPTRRFDPEAHLTKQGWKGKGTALKHGHLTRPLPVVRKKTLSGIGKDRDEAVPFWDNIFAATAASILSTTPTSGASPAASNSASPAPEVIGEVKHHISLSAGARMSREVARRGLYSRFFRGKPYEPEVKEVPDVQTEAGPSTASASGTRISTSVTIEQTIMTGRQGATMTVDRSGKGKGKSQEGEETKEERRARRAEKTRRKEEKEARRAEKAEKKAGRGTPVGAVEPGDDGGKKRKRRKDSDEPQGTDGAVPRANMGKVGKEKKRKKGEGA